MVSLEIPMEGWTVADKLCKQSRGAPAKWATPEIMRLRLAFLDEIADLCSQNELDEAAKLRRELEYTDSRAKRQAAAERLRGSVDAELARIAHTPKDD